jgi:hypothetical protein
VNPAKAIMVWGPSSGAAQYFRAPAAGVTPSMHMNPVLPKPKRDTARQRTVQGCVEAAMSPLQWRERSSHRVETASARHHWCGSSAPMRRFNCVNGTAFGHTLARQLQPKMQRQPQRPGPLHPHQQPLLSSQRAGVSLDALEPGDALERLLGQRARAGLDPHAELPHRVRKVIGGAGSRQRQRGAVAAVRVHHQRARPVLEDRKSLLAPAPRAEVIDPTRLGLGGAPGAGPRAGLLRLAPARLQHADRCLVGVNHPAGEHEAAVRSKQRPQWPADLPVPARQRRARRMQARARVDLRLPVVREGDRRSG